MLVLLISQSSAWAEDAAPSTAIVTIPGAQAERSWSDHLADRIAENTQELDAIPQERSRQKLVNSRGRNALRNAEQYALEAQRALDAFEDLEQTARLLQRAANAHLQLLPLLETLDDPLRLLISLATVQLALRQSEGVRRALDTAVRLDPTLSLDPQEVSPRLISAVREARQRMEGMPILAPEQARELASTLDVERIVLVQPRPDRRQTLVETYDSSTGDRLRSWTIRGNDVTAVATALAPSSAAVGSRSSAQPTAEPEATPTSEETGEGPPTEFGEEDPTEFSATPPERDEPPSRPFYRTWWFWTIVGAVVAGGATTGIVLGVQSQSGAGDLSLEVHSHW